MGRMRATWVAGRKQGAERPPESLSLNTLTSDELSPPHVPYSSRRAVPNNSPEQSVQLELAVYVCVSQRLHTPQTSVTQPGYWGGMLGGVGGGLSGGDGGGGDGGGARGGGGGGGGDPGGASGTAGGGGAGGGGGPRVITGATTYCRDGNAAGSVSCREASELAVLDWALAPSSIIDIETEPAVSAEPTMVTWSPKTALSDAVAPLKLYGTAGTRVAASWSWMVERSRPCASAAFASFTYSDVSAT